MTDSRQLGSGVVEGGIKHVIGSRVKGSGRRWLLQGLAARSWRSSPTRFEVNLAEKLADPDFAVDVLPLPAAGREEHRVASP